MCEQFLWMSFRSFCCKYCLLYILSFCGLTTGWTRQYKNSNTWLHTCGTAVSWFLHFFFSIFFNTKLPIIIEPRLLTASRGTRSKVYSRIVALNIFAKFTEKQLWQSLFSIKLQAVGIQRFFYKTHPGNFPVLWQSTIKIRGVFRILAII